MEVVKRAQAPTHAVPVTVAGERIPGGLINGDTVWMFPQLLYTGSRGETLVWGAFVALKRGREPKPAKSSPNGADEYVRLTDALLSGETATTGPAVYWTEAGQMDGKLKRSHDKVVSVGKNIGRSNETTVVTQALRDAFGLHKRCAQKVDSERIPPMLAQTIRQDEIPTLLAKEGRLFAQYKYNGIRAVARWVTGAVDLQARGGKHSYVSLNAISTELTDILRARPWLCLDGEIYAHGMPLQELSGIARTSVGEVSPAVSRVKYIIYDCFCAAKAAEAPITPDSKYSDRLRFLSDFWSVVGPGKGTLELVATHEFADVAGVDELYRQAVSEGYEGVMLRLDAAYDPGHNNRHSKRLLKLKPVYDGEFEVVDWTTGTKGRAAEAVMFVCKLPVGDTVFNVTPAMTINDRNALALRMAEKDADGVSHFDKHYRGKPLIVHYDELSTKGVPLRARTEGVIRTWL